MTYLSTALADSPTALWPLTAAYADLSSPTNPIFYDIVSSFDIAKISTLSAAFYGANTYDMGLYCGAGGPTQSPEALALYGMPIGRKPAPPALDPGTGPWTVEAWVLNLTTGTAGLPGIYHWGEGSPFGSPGAMFNFFGGSGAGFRWDVGGAQLNSSYGASGLDSSRPCPNHGLHHLVWTYDGAGNHHAYQNGTQTATATQVLSAMAPAVATLMVGTNLNSAGTQDVVLSHVALYLSALSPTRVAAHYAAGNIPCSPCGGWEIGHIRIG